MGVCEGCKACLTNKGKPGEPGCNGCWKASVNNGSYAPPCNLRGTSCLSDDELSCQACWSPSPLPLAWKVAASLAKLSAAPAECESCFTGGCKGCKGYCETNKDGACANCWNEAAGAPPCNRRGVSCLADDKLSCEACWSSAPLPSEWKVAAAAKKLTAALPQCDACLTGACKACKGYCELHKDGTCAGCWTASNTNGSYPTQPPCNLRGIQCLADDGVGCEACWKLPPPSPPPAPPPGPT